MTALPGYIIIIPLKEEQITSSGFAVAETQKDRPVKGIVYSVGSTFVTDQGVKLESPVQEGDIVYYRKWAGDEIKEGEKEYRVVKFSECVALA